MLHRLQIVHINIIKISRMSHKNSTLVKHVKFISAIEHASPCEMSHNVKFLERDHLFSFQ